MLAYLEKIHTWTHSLPDRDGYYYFKDIDTEEHGIAYVRGLGADIFVPVSALDGAAPYLSSAYWAEHEQTNPNWLWKGPIGWPHE